MKFSKGWTLVLCLLVAAVFVATTFAQETTAGLQGTVKDPQGAVVSKATVEVTSPTLIGVKKLETDASGYYRFSNLPPGAYTITVTAQGFRTLKQSGVNLEVGKLPTIDLSLQIGGAEQTIEVSSQAPIVDVTQSKVQTNVTSDELNAIPKGRSFQSVIALSPGARVEPLQGNGYQINGASNAENTYLVEGQDTGNIQTGVSQANVPMEFIQEVQVKSGGFEAEYGGALGGVVNVIQKRGSNEWHGSIVGYYSGDKFDDSSTNATGTANSTLRYLRQVPGTAIDYTSRTDRPSELVAPKKDHYRIVSPGFDVGGFLVKDRIWAFTSFVPQVSRLRRTVNWAYNPPASSGVSAVNGPRDFQQDTDTYYALSRLDWLATSKIRVYGAWQTNYSRQQGGSLPNADDAYGLTNTTVTGPPDNYAYKIGNLSPNVIYNVGADITITPSLVATTRYGYFFNDYQTRGIPEGTYYGWRNTNYNYGGISTMKSDGTSLYNSIHDSPLCSAEDIAANLCNTSYGTTAGTPLPSQYLRATGYTTIGANTQTFFDRYWRKSFSQDLAYFKKGFFGTHNLKGGYARNNLSNDVKVMYNTADVYLGYGQTIVVGGAQNMQNCIDINTYNNANFGTHLNTTNPSRCGGYYGTVNLRDLQTTGKVGSNNNSLYIQDAWTLGTTGVTLNLGLRVDNENLPNYLPDAAGFKGISWGFGDKLAPRLGGAWDVFRNGKLKLYGSFGYFYDIMKFELPRGSFGGDYWHDCIYALDNPDFSIISPVRAAGTGAGSGKDVYCNYTGGANGTGFGNPARPNDGLIANLDFRAPSNNAADYRVDPNLKPMKQKSMTFGADWAISPVFGFESRYTRNRLIRTIEDAGFVDSTGSENFFIVNPGEGIHAGSGLVPATDCPPGECGVQPNATRNYDAVEFRLTKKASAKWFGSLSYTYSRLYGNYGGLTSSYAFDGGSAAVAGGGRLSPNVSRSFDEPFMQFTAAGKVAEGLLPTDRPHTVTAFGYYRLKFWKMESLVGATQFIYSGTPVGSYILTGGNAFAPQFVAGEDKWVNFHIADNGDMVVDGVTSKRTPAFSQTNFNFLQSMHVSKSNEKLVLSFEANVINLLNQHAVVSYADQMSANNEVVDPQLHTPATSQSGIDYPTLTHYGYDYAAVFNGDNPANGGAGVSSRSYGKPNLWQNGRTMRFAVRFTF
ncbi:MAG: carboxypeptidase regulatory-like domain-containing protein [Acidobacteriaceae bacterium]